MFIVWIPVTRASSKRWYSLISWDLGSDARCTRVWIFAPRFSNCVTQAICLTSLPTFSPLYSKKAFDNTLALRAIVGMKSISTSKLCIVSPYFKLVVYVTWSYPSFSFGGDFSLSVFNCDSVIFFFFGLSSTLSPISHAGLVDICDSFWTAAFLVFTYLFILDDWKRVSWVSIKKEPKDHDPILTLHGRFSPLWHLHDILKVLVTS